MDTFTPLGPWVTPATETNAGDVGIETQLNGETVQEARTGGLIFGVAALVNFAVRYAPVGRRRAHGNACRHRRDGAGDEIKVEIEGVGLLRNAIVAPESAMPEGIWNVNETIGQRWPNHLLSVKSDCTPTTLANISRRYQLFRSR